MVKTVCLQCMRGTASIDLLVPGKGKRAAESVAQRGPGLFRTCGIPSGAVAPLHKPGVHRVECREAAASRCLLQQLLAGFVDAPADGGCSRL